MIEYQHDDEGWSDVTSEVADRCVPREMTFNVYRLRINGVVYHEQSAEFREVLEKEITWAKISNA